eukprot:8962079-Pyramimonas_sp.AAC.1
MPRGLTDQTCQTQRVLPASSTIQHERLHGLWRTLLRQAEAARPKGPPRAPCVIIAAARPRVCRCSLGIPPR